MPIPSTIKSVAVAALSLPVAGWRAVPADGQMAAGYTGQTPPGPLSHGHAVSPGANCRGCHQPPHPGRQNDCLACHNQNSWSADRVNGGET